MSLFGFVLSGVAKEPFVWLWRTEAFYIICTREPRDNISKKVVLIIII
jgi:hypothetical protein